MVSGFEKGRKSAPSHLVVAELFEAHPSTVGQKLLADGVPSGHPGRIAGLACDKDRQSREAMPDLLAGPVDGQKES